MFKSSLSTVSITESLKKKINKKSDMWNLSDMDVGKTQWTYINWTFSLVSSVFLQKQLGILLHIHLILARNTQLQFLNLYWNWLSYVSCISFALFSGLVFWKINKDFFCRVLCCSQLLAYIPTGVLPSMDFHVACHICDVTIRIWKLQKKFIFLINMAPINPQLKQKFGNYLF